MTKFLSGMQVLTSNWLRYSLTKLLRGHTNNMCHSREGVRHNVTHIQFTFSTTVSVLLEVKNLVLFDSKIIYLQSYFIYNVFNSSRQNRLNNQ
jgi:hypothetical protein